MRRPAAILLLLLAAQAPAPTTPPAAAPPAPPPAEWLPRANVELRALDKVTARSATLSGKVGQTLRFGALSITVTACNARPPDQPQDFAAFLEITDSHPDTPGFRGWMFANTPSVSIFEDPGYDIRLAACRP